MSARDKAAGACQPVGYEAYYDHGKALRAELERMVDRSSLACVLEALAAVCCEKASHVDSVWQDERLAMRWSAAAKALDRLTVTRTIQVLP